MALAESPTSSRKRKKESPTSSRAFATLRPLSGKVALVTGSSEGIGAGIALEFAKGGADVCINCNSKDEEAEQVAAQCREQGVRSIYSKADVSDRRAVEEMFEKILKELGPVDIVVTNAMTSKRVGILETEFQDLKRCVEIGVYGVFHCIQIGAKQMLAAGKKGSIVHLGSPHVYWPCKECIDYNTTKAASDNLVLSAANELMWKGIRVNIVLPGWTYTQGEVRLYGQEQLDRQAQKMPLNRLAYTEDIGRAVMWVCSEEASFVVGATIKVDGGAFIETGPSWIAPPRERG